MNKAFKWSIAFLAVMAMGCSEDELVKKPAGDPAYSGDDVVFTFAGQNPESRTTYAEPWAETGSQDIYWGNYIADQVEQIKVYCRESDGNMAVYNVNPNTSEGSSTAISIGKADENTSIRWGAQYTDRDYEFYSFYPAAAAGNAFVGTEGHVIQASVETGQVPRMYKYKVGDGELQEKSLSEIASASAGTTANTIFAMPDMESAIMMAHTSVKGTPDEANGTGYGYPVPLDFNVIADVLDITVNGPVTPNTLGGNGNGTDDKGIELKYIKIRSITIESKSKKALSGKFTLDMDNGVVTPLENNYRILVSTSEEGQYPTLHVRSESPETVDKLRVRVFLMPGQVTNLNDLTVTVGTDCGDYTVDLQSTEMIKGAIHPIKLNYFKKRGVSFNFAQWIGQLDPNIYITELSIPGTWHSSNSNYQGSATLKEQYDAGIRAFEVHTTNGIAPFADNEFKTAFDAATAEYYPEHVNVINSTDGVVEILSHSGGTTTYGYPTWNNSIGAYTRTVTVSNATINAEKVFSRYQQKPKFYLRLYRTRNVSGGVYPEESFSDALITLAETMNPTGFMFFEFGMNGETGFSVNCKTVQTASKTSWTGTVTGVQTGSYYDYGDPVWDYSSITVPATATWGEATPDVTDYDHKISYTGREAWPIAVESCINRLAAADNTSTGKKVLYTSQITRNTTIKDVQGSVIVKINTNHDGGTNTNELSWSGNTPALFSRWIRGNDAKVETVNLKWGAPIVPTPLEMGADDLHWCFSEQDNVAGNNGVANRKTAMGAYSDASYANYEEGLHRTFYEFSVGGYLTTLSTEGCQNLAKELNPELVKVLTDPTRKPCPFGIVFMNYAIPPTGEEDTYKSSELIRTIINNNAAFMLQRRSDTSSATAADRTNSSFTGNNGNPLK